MKVLRWYQRAAIDAARACWDSGEPNALIVLATGPGREAEILQAPQQGWQALLDPIKLHPGGAGEQIHAGLTHPLLLAEAQFHGPHAAAAFQPFHIKQQGLSHTGP